MNSAKQMEKIKMSKLLFMAALLYSLIFCSDNHKSKAEAITKPQKTTIEEKIILPDGFKPDYTIKKEENLDFGNVTRIQLRLVVPFGLDKNEVKNNIKDAVIYTYKKYSPDGIAIFMYGDGDNINSAYTVAKADFAPFGQWNKINQNTPLDIFELNFHINDSYFLPQSTLLQNGTSVKLYMDKKYDFNQRKFVSAKFVSLSSSAKSWADEDIIAKVPNYTKATIKDSHKEKLSNGSEIIMYKVRVTYKGKTYIGWVDQDYLLKNDKK